VQNPEGKKKPLVEEYMDLDGDGDGFDSGDLEVAYQAYWNDEPAGGPKKVWKYSLKDHLGGTTHTVDSRGEVVSHQQYHPYGKTAYRDGARPTYGFAGSEIEEEEELGLVQFGARWYAGEIGRWVSADWKMISGAAENIVSSLEANPYVYAFNSPIVFFDVVGMQGTTSSSSIDWVARAKSTRKAIESPRLDAHCPINESGVSIGYGVDFKVYKDKTVKGKVVTGEDQLYRFLKQHSVPENTRNVLKTAAKLHGSEAKTWCARNSASISSASMESMFEAKWKTYTNMARARATSYGKGFQQSSGGTVMSTQEYDGLHEAVKATHVLLTYNSAQNQGQYRGQINAVLDDASLDTVGQLEGLKTVVLNYPIQKPGQKGLITKGGQRAMVNFIDQAISDVQAEQAQSQTNAIQPTVSTK
jgi:RHS repeat-associated protein